MKARLVLISGRKEQRKIRCFEWDLNSHFGFLNDALPINTSSQLGLVASLIQFKCTGYFHDDLTFVFENAHCFKSISELCRSSLSLLVYNTIYRMHYCSFIRFGKKGETPTYS